MLILAVNKALENHNTNNFLEFMSECMDLNLVFTTQLGGGNAKLQSVN